MPALLNWRRVWLFDDALLVSKSESLCFSGAFVLKYMKGDGGICPATWRGRVPPLASRCDGRGCYLGENISASPVALPSGWVITERPVLIPCFSVLAWKDWLKLLSIRLSL